MLTGSVFDASQRLADAAAQGLGVAWLPTRLLQRDVQAGLLVPVVDLECGARPAHAPVLA